jgi:Uri superfamily endonuclease
MPSAIANPIARYPMPIRIDHISRITVLKWREGYFGFALNSSCVQRVERQLEDFRKVSQKWHWRDISKAPQFPRIEPHVPVLGGRTASSAV